jgi:hypothetical protein|tara:strand:- start:27268 stop:27573 length:306 start_codon:yes stop_codon:yes gene_type:complete
MVRAAKTDANAKAIDIALYIHGATVAKTDSVGSGFPDRVVGFHGKNFLLEYKDGSKPLSRRRLNDHQQRWHKAWTGQVDVVSNAKEALEVVCGVPYPDGTH